MNSKKNYRPVTPNAVPVAQLRSWLGTCGIAFQPSTTPGCDLTVRCSDGSSLEVAVSLNLNNQPLNALVIPAKSLTAKSRDVAFATFHQITEAAGYGKPIPVDRGEEPKQKLHYSSDPDSVALRHREFSRSPNATAAQYAFYEPVIKKAAGAFLKMNRDWCDHVGLEMGDLRTYCLGWVTIYIARYERPAEECTSSDNEKKCYAFLRQRLREMRSIQMKKDRSISVDDDTAHIGLFGDIMDMDELARRNDPREWISTEETADRQRGQEEYAEEHAEVDLSSATARRKSVQKLLADKLGSLDHLELLGTLQKAIGNDSFSYDVQREARRQLRLHCESCDDAGCVAMRNVDDEDDQDVTE